MVNPYKRPESILLIIHTTGEEVLLLKRSDHPHFWQSITGSMKWQEQFPIDTAIRELKEETGTEVTGTIRDLNKTYRYQILPQWRHRYAPGVTENIEHVFALKFPQISPITLNPNEHSAFQWLPFSEAAKESTSWSNRDAIVQLSKMVA